MIQVVYHNKDLDGFVSGYLVAKHYYDRGHQVNMIGWNYGDPIPEFLEKVDIAMTDISFPPDEMLRLFKNNTAKQARQGGIILWIDHHRSAIEDSIKHGYNSIDGVRREGDSATLLAWEWFNGPITPPFLVTIVDRYDVFKQEDFECGPTHLWWNDVLKFQYGLRQLIQDPVTDDGYFEIENLMGWNPFVGFYENDSIYQKGETIQKVYDDQNKQRAKDICIDNRNGRKIAVVYGERPDIEVLKYVEDKSITAIQFNTIKDGRIEVSMRKTKDSDVDILSIAKINGGGGHPHACGYRINTAPNSK